MPSPAPPAPLDPESQDDRDISPDHYRYIRSLNESPVCYTRFFDALLIPKPSHGQFLHDLQTFREQPAIIGLLQQGTKDAYRECTRAFIASRFAHPWCRTTSDCKAGWMRASWLGATKKVSRDAQREEDRLHRLLVPLWIAFRRRMFPELEVLDEWIAREEQKRQSLKAEAEAEAAAQADAGDEANDQDGDGTRKDLVHSSPDQPPRLPPDYPELGFKTAATATTAASGPSSRPAAKTSSSGPDGSGAAASQMFLGVAVTGFLMSDKRVRKYVEKKLKKK